MTEATETGQTIETMFLEERRYSPSEDFAAESLAGRINDMECRFLITHDEGRRSGRRCR